MHILTTHIGADELIHALDLHLDEECILTFRTPVALIRSDSVRYLFLVKKLVCE